MTQQTAVEWLIKEIESLITIETFQRWKVLKEQAKQMEKEQIENAYVEGFMNSAEGWNGEYGIMDFSNIKEEISSEKYYNETYGK